MREIKCPNCGQVFKVDESGYARILRQVRDSELEKEIARREKELAEKNKQAMKIAQMERQKKLSEEMGKKEALISEKYGS